MKFTFEVDGRDVTLSYDELEAIVREKLSAHAVVEVCQTPTEGKAFDINPMAIDKSLFFEERKDKKQEQTRQYILKAFAEVDANPEKYAKPFKTMRIKKTWKDGKTGKELCEMANAVGHLADWVEQSMEWAQRIANGENWSKICNGIDTANWYRLVMWKDGYLRLVGGARGNYDLCPASDVCSERENFSDDYFSTVPLVVLR